MSILQRQNPLFNNKEQKKLKNMVVLIAGAGGLGTNQAQQLQRIGIKKIYLYDYDKIVESNLNRQLFYGKNDIGKSKVKKTKEHLDSFELNTKIKIFEKKIDKNLEIPDDVDIIFDALDNFSSRFALEKIARKNNLPLIHGGVQSWYGQITAIIPGKTVSLKEIFGVTDKNENESPPVFSPVVSVIASIQVIEGIKVYLNKDDILLNKLLIIDLNQNTIDTVELN
ncbi:MAG TPA: HesA/MoeB/ThiF family protein [Halanaerobiales bacterium]|nr:HesA/MoeB/ThiF family protein [Halanaerobiales bacterium]